MKSREIIRAVALEHGLQPRDLLGRDRFGHFIAARREAMVRLREAGFSYPQIGRFLGRDHSTIVFHVNKAKAGNHRQGTHPRTGGARESGEGVA